MKTKSLAYDALVDYAISSLPIKIEGDSLKNIKFFSWQQYCAEIGKPKQSYIYRQDGAVMCLDANVEPQFVIFYNDGLPEKTKQWVIAKLLYYVRGGFAEGHVGQYIMPDDKKEAEEFATYFLCPDAVLSECGIVSEKDIMHYCQVPFQVARRKARSLKEGCERFMLPSLEKMVKEQFSHDIQRMKCG